MGRRIGAVIVLAMLVLLSWPAPASAHASLVATTPAEGGHLDQGPADVVFTLNEAVSVVPGSPQLIDEEGKRYGVRAVALNADRTVVTVRLATALPDGSFLATARLLSVDTHVVSVSVAFTVGAAEDLLTAPEAETDGLPGYVARLLVHTGAVLSAGVLLTTARLWPHLRERRRWRVTVRCGSALLVAGLTARLGLVFAETGWTVLTSGFGIASLAAVVAAAVQLRLPGRWLAAVPTVLAVMYGGHGADPGLFPLPLALTTLHVYAVLAWLGGVVVIAVELHRGVPIAAWHRYALIHAAVVVGTGAGLGLLRIPAPDALLSTTYGRVLIVKIGLVALVLATAAVAYRRLGRFVGAELLLATAVFGATGVLSSVAPATADYDPPVRTTVDFGPGSALAVTIPSTRRGPQDLIVEAADEAPLSVDLSSREANVARLPVRFGGTETTGTGVRWSSRDLVVPVAGNWQVTITFGTPAGPRVASFRYDVR
ncbi:copper resistance protein CopC [Actinoplanes regularis]|uniref:copper resistance CopC/CopD family protein n=1 Tax=Actinoplanes regularis TaxID=52697 RepID=UPI0024A081EF|nr:copper resistance protein CopC [Actinoplanes regularis]GLW30315.1 copper-binding protein [Actinoplanes regularis]